MAWYDPTSWDFSSPTPWVLGLGALGTGMGLYGQYNAQKAQAQQANQYNQILAANQAAMAAQNQAINNYYNQYAGYLGNQNQAISDYYGNLMGMINAPFDPFQYYTPMSEAAQRAALRAVRADLGARGTAPGSGGYAAGIVANAALAQEWQNMMQAAGLAQGVRQNNLSAFGGAGYPRYPAPGAPISPSYLGYPPALPYTGGGNMGGLGTALQYLQAQNAAKAPSVTLTTPTTTSGSWSGANIYGGDDETLSANPAYNLFS